MKKINFYNKKSGKFLGAFDSFDEFRKIYPIHRIGKTCSFVEYEDFTKEAIKYINNLPLVKKECIGSGDMWEGFTCKYYLNNKEVFRDNNNGYPITWSKNNYEYLITAIVGKDKDNKLYADGVYYPGFVAVSPNEI